MCYEFEILNDIQNPGTNYSVKQKLDRIQPQHEFLSQFFFITPGHLPGSLDTGFGWSKIHVVDKLIRDRG
ncbi:MULTISPECIES: hypothetical protein [unclassified Microcoleus]|uniref:hypothetical protein n=1 Tax=unclassified Microcoleus TaxID=2642155 RepID=UPI002FD7641C